jgi:hypothetical protein
MVGFRFWDGSDSCRSPTARPPEPTGQVLPSANDSYGDVTLTRPPDAICRV